MGNQKIRSIQKLSEESGVGRNALYRLYNDDFERIDTSTLSALCSFFQCEVGDILYYEKEG
jgi:putative transcriptional regulator